MSMRSLFVGNKSSCCTEYLYRLLVLLDVSSLDRVAKGGFEYEPHELVLREALMLLGPLV